jgi:hemerythrin-like metal-binding protein
MSLVKWSDALSVGVPSLDDQHKKMLGLLNQLHDGMMSGKDKMALGEVLKTLIASTAMHFKYEEDLLARSGYPDGPSHRNEHAELARQIQSIRREYETIGPSAMTIPVMSFLKNWLTAHILGADMRYRSHLVAKGVK